jgi:hypothetical protein
LESIADNPEIMQLIEDGSYDDLINLIEGIWVILLDTNHYTVMV